MSLINEERTKIFDLIGITIFGELFRIFAPAIG